MPVHNTEIAEIFNEYADLLEIEGTNQYRVRAYRNAARNISVFSRSIAEMANQKEDLSSIPGLGEDLTVKVFDIVNTGKLLQLEKLKERLPAGLLDIIRLPGLGPKRTGVLYSKLGVTSIEQLEAATKQHKVRELPGFSVKMEENILEDIKRRGKAGTSEKRYKLFTVEEMGEDLLSYLKKINGVKRVAIAGSYRRRKETVGDLDILVTHEKQADVMQQFTEYEDVERIVSRGETRSTVILRSGIQIDLRSVTEDSYGAAMHYFTGSKAHNIAIRKKGVNKGLKINEYGVFQGDELITGRTEEEIYARIDLPYIEPELRENNGEIEAAQEGKLPKLISLQDINGDLHSHTSATDGRSTLEEMARAAKEKGYQYLAITDHSKHVTVAHGLDAERLAQQIDEIERLNDRLDGIVLLKGIEVDILEDGSLDLPHDILKRLDLVVCAVHYKFNLPADKQTERIIRGIDNPYSTILAHPTGRIIGEREPYQLDMERLMKAARETGCILELNAQPSRLDLTEVYAKMAKEMNVMVAISTDSHSINELDFMRFGIYQARRGWLEPEDVLNTRSRKELQKLLKK
jgi:DNA polymerase (family X)